MIRKIYIRVFNADHSSKEPYRTIEGKSPIQWWKEMRGLPENKEVNCSCLNCHNAGEDGAHVIDMKTGKHLFIVPLCHTHNESNDDFNVLEDCLEECTDIERQGELINLNSEKHKSISINRKRPTPKFPNGGSVG